MGLNGVDRDDADDSLGRLVALGRHVPGVSATVRSILDRWLLVRQAGDVVIRVEDLQLGRDVDVGSQNDLAGLVLVQAHLHLVEVAVQNGRPVR